MKRQLTCLRRIGLRPEDKPEKDKMMKLFHKYQDWIVDEKRMELAKPTAHYMHCLPCERGAEVSDAVLDGKWGEPCFNEAEIACMRKKVSWPRLSHETFEN